MTTSSQLNQRSITSAAHYNRIYSTIFYLIDMDFQHQKWTNNIIYINNKEDNIHKNNNTMDHDYRTVGDGS